VSVVEESRLIGIVLIGDVLKWCLDELKHESARLLWRRRFRGGPDRGDGGAHVLTLEEAMAEAARRVAPYFAILPKMNIAPFQEPFDLKPETPKTTPTEV